MKPPLPKLFRVTVLLAVPISLLAGVGVILTDDSPWVFYTMMPGVFLAGYVVRDIEVR